MARNKPARYSAFDLVKRGLKNEQWPRLWEDLPLNKSYDAIVIGGGVHGLATAYYLAKDHGMTNVAVMDKGYLGGGGSGRNTAIVRSNYLTPEGINFYNRSLELYGSMANDHNLNVMFSERGHLTLAHSDASLRTMRWRAEVNKLQNINSRVIGPDEVKKIVPSLDISRSAAHPIEGALFHPPGGIIRHDAVVWAYARSAAAMGTQMHQKTEVLDIICEGGEGPDGKGPGGKVTGVRTNRGDVSAPVVVNCTAGWATLISDMAGVKLPKT